MKTEKNLKKIFMETKISKGQKKYIREEKARIRRGVFDFKTQEEMIGKLYQKLSKK